MSVMIRGMEMPKEGTFNIVHIYDDGHVSMPFWGKGMQIVSGITAVPVPPHGRLIDADELREYWLENGENEYVYDTNAFLESLDDAPTIIPPSGGKENE